MYTPISEMMTWAARSPIPRDRHQQLCRREEREGGPVDPGVQPGDHVSKVVDVFEVKGAHQQVLVTEAARAGQGQFGDLRSHPPASQVRQYGRVAFLGDQRLDHVAGRG
jgi:hypothetical protein